MNKSNCLLCGSPLVYSLESLIQTCELCKGQFESEAGLRAGTFCLQYLSFLFCKRADRSCVRSQHVHKTGGDGHLPDERAVHFHARAGAPLPCTCSPAGCLLQSNWRHKGEGKENQSRTPESWQCAWRLLRFLWGLRCGCGYRYFHQPDHRFNPTFPGDLGTGKPDDGRKPALYRRPGRSVLLQAGYIHGAQDGQKICEGRNSR